MTRALICLALLSCAPVPSTRIVPSPSITPQISATPNVTPSPVVTPSPAPTVVAPSASAPNRIRATSAPARNGTVHTGTRTVSSTAFCEHGTMKSGRRTYAGAAAVPRSEFRALQGSRWQIVSGPLAGKTVTVEDQIGHSSQFDIWLPSCGKEVGGARWYGRRSITIRRVA